MRGFTWWIYFVLVEILVIVVTCFDILASNWRARLLRFPRARLWPQPVDYPVGVWFHAVSLGEAQVLWAVLKCVPEAERRHWLVTTSTEAGMGLLEKHIPAVQLRYLPFDLPSMYSTMLNKQKPHLVLVETELWPNLFAYLGNEPKITIINARLSEVSLRNSKRWQGLLMQMAQRLTKVLARNPLDAKRFERLGTPPECLQVSGNIKYDIHIPQLQQPQLKQWFDAGAAPLLFASISTDEVPLLAPQLLKIQQALPQQRILWVPRHLTTKDLEQHEKQLQPLKPVRFSQWQPSQAPPQVLILDIFGQLGACYAGAELALVGGSFNQRGGQNFLEPMQAGTPVMVGPNTKNFQSETDDALAANALLQLSDASQVAAAVLDWVQNPDRGQKIVRSATQFLDQHRGAIAQTIRCLIDLGILEPQHLEEHP